MKEVKLQKIRCTRHLSNMYKVQDYNTTRWQNNKLCSLPQTEAPSDERKSHKESLTAIVSHKPSIFFGFSASTLQTLQKSPKHL